MFPTRICSQFRVGVNRSGLGAKADCPTMWFRRHSGSKWTIRRRFPHPRPNLAIRHNSCCNPGQQSDLAVRLCVSRPGKLSRLREARLWRGTSLRGRVFFWS